jgi:hypothetical protein
MSAISAPESRGRGRHSGFGQAVQWAGHGGVHAGDHMEHRETGKALDRRAHARVVIAVVPAVSGREPDARQPRRRFLKGA